MTIPETKHNLMEGNKFNYSTGTTSYQLKLRTDGVGYLVLASSSPLPNHIAFLLKDRLHIIIYSSSLCTIQDVPYSLIKFQ